MAVEDLYFAANPQFIMEGGATTLTVNWTRGTDIIYTTTFGDSSPIYTWNWLTEGHVTHYGALETTVSHTYTTMGNYTGTLSIGNAVGSQDVDRDVVVEANLEDYLTLQVASSPRATPMEATLSLNLTQAAPVPILVWCDVTYGDGTNGSLYGAITTNGDVQFSHTYTLDVPDVTTTVTCGNHVSSYVLSTLVILQTPIIGLQVSKDQVAVSTGIPANFTLTMTNGSHAEFTSLYGDGSEEDTAHTNRLSHLSPHKLSHIYTSPGNYSVNITAWNTHFNATNDIENVIVQNPLHALSLTGPSVVQVPPGTATFDLNPADNTLPQPTDVFCTWYLSKSQPISEYSPEVADNLAVSRSHTFTRADCGVDRYVNVTCYNMVSEETAVWNLTVQEEIRDLVVVGNPPHGAPGQMLDISVSLSNGSDVGYTIDYGDTNSDNAQHPNLFASSTPMEFTHTYNAIGNYSLDVTAANIISNARSQDEVEIIIQNTIRNISVYGPGKVLWPPGRVEYILGADSSQPLLGNLHCSWDYDVGLASNLYIDTLNSGENISHTYVFPRSSIGNITTMVNCSNLISWLNVSVDVEIELDAVILRSLRTNGSVLWNYTSEIILDVQRFGTYSCFLFDMGDNIEQVMYGVTECSTNATDFGVTFIEIPFGQMSIIHEKVYDEFGVYHGSVFAFNHVTNHTLTTRVVVEDWPCSRPNISLPDELSDPLESFINMKSVAFSIVPNISIDCMKTEIYSTTWDFYQIPGPTNPIMTSTDETLNYTVRMLPYGTYELQLYVAMVSTFFNVTGMDRTSLSRLEIIKTPLIVQIAGNQSIFLPYNRSLVVDALNPTIDPDVEPDDKSGFLYTWFCKRQEEAWSMIGGDISRSQLGLGSYHDLYQYGGCFGYGAGVIDNNEGILENNTLDMFPFTR